jgi:hypothetical protein
MTQTLHGGCACGAIRYEASAAPAFMLNCHCRHCQRATGSAYAAIVVFDKKSLVLTGKPQYFTSTGVSGGKVERGFCGACGNPVNMKLARMPDIACVYAASLDDPSQFRPGVDLFTASAQGWDHMHPDLPKRPGGTQG